MACHRYAHVEMQMADAVECYVSTAVTHAIYAANIILVMIILNDVRMRGLQRINKVT